MLRRSLSLSFFIIVILGVIAVYGYEASPTGYYLPLGYKVSAQITVPDAPWLPGESVGDIVGLSCSQYSVLVIGYGCRDVSFQVHTGIKVVWKEAGSEKIVADINMGVEKGEYKIYIVYGSDGYVKISYSAGGTDVKPQAIYSFRGDVSKYTIVSQGAQVNEPTQIASIGSDDEIGEGYNPITSETLILVCLGAGVVGIVTLFFVFRR